MTSTVDAMKQRLIRYGDLIPCKNAFVDTRTPGSDSKENFTIIGPGVSENPNQHVHLPEPHGFNIGAARQPGGCLNSQHSHETAEVFVIHSGHWRFPFGTERQDGSFDAGPGDVVSVPIHMFRGFEKLDDGVGFLWVVLGEDDPGKVTWAPSVFDLAEHYGLKLLKGGKLVDTTVGETVPENAELETPPDADLISQLRTPSLEKLLGGYCAVSSMVSNPKSALSGDGVEEAGVITPEATGDGFAAGPIKGWWPHRFNLRRLKMETGAQVPTHHRKEAEVIFVHEGTLTISFDDGDLVMGAGDTLSIPAGTERQFSNMASRDMLAYVVRGGDSPAMPVFSSSSAQVA